MAEDYYKTLGVSRDAQPAEIQKAYRELARKYHPDLHPDDKHAKKKFQELQAAFDVLNDPSKRELYDRYGHSFEDVAAGRAQAGASRGGFSGAGPQEFDFSQIFGERFGGGGFADVFNEMRQGQSPRGRSSRGGRKQRGDDLRHELEIPFLAAVNGDELPLQIQRDGKVDNLSVKIPPGIEDGQTIRLRGQGQPGPRADAAGDLLITIHIAAHPYFQRSGKDLIVKVPVTLAEAALGAKVEIPTPRGKVSVQVPPATSSGKKLRIRGQGVPSTTGEPGDLLAEVQVVLPAKLDAESQKLVSEFDRRNPLNPRHHFQ